MTEKITNTNLLHALNWRYATKRFDPDRKIPTEDWHALMQALVLAPASFGLQPFAYINVESQNVRTNLREHSWKQSQITDASHLIVFCTQISLSENDVARFIENTAKTRGTPLEKLAGYKDMMTGFVVKGMGAEKQKEWMARQLYIALGQLMTAAALVGIDTCAIEGLDPAKYDEILGLTQKNLRTVCALALGYRHHEDVYAQAKKVRKSTNELIITV